MLCSSIDKESVERERERERSFATENLFCASLPKDTVNIRELKLIVQKALFSAEQD